MSDREPSGEELVVESEPAGEETAVPEDEVTETPAEGAQGEATDLEPEPESEPQSEPEPESEPQSEPEPEASSEPQSEPEPEAQSEPEPEASSEPEAEPEPDSGAPSEPEPAPAAVPQPEPAPETSGGIQGYLEVAVARLEEGKAVFGERLLVMGSGPLPSLGEAEGTMGLDDKGNVVLLVAMRSVDQGAAAPITRELDDIGGLTEDELSQLAEADGAVGLKRRHDDFFSGVEHVSPSSLNGGQRAILLLEEEPSVDTWETLLSELGDRLAGVYVVESEAAWTVTPTETETTRTEEQLEVAESEPEFIDERPQPSNALWIGIVVIGVALAIWGLSHALLGSGGTPPSPSGADTVPSPVRDVAVGTSYDATHTQWIGQSHILRTSDGRLLVLYRSPGGLRIVADRSNQGRAWRHPTKIGSIVADSFSAAIDSQDIIHVAYHNGSNVSYATLQQEGVRWRKTGEISLDDSSTSPVVDIGWDEAAGVAHVIWAKDASSGQEPYWAAVDTKGPEPVLLQSKALAKPGASLSVLATIDVDSNSNVLATYRRPDQLQGWYSRTATLGDSGTYTWEAEEGVPTKEGIGAVSVVIDPSGTAHMVLRDSTSFELDYYTKKPGHKWSKLERIVDANSTPEIDFPSLSVDISSKLVYVFFQTNQSQVGSEVHVSVHDPASGWESPYAIAEPTDIPGGAAFPTSIGTIAGQPIVLWTKGGTAPAIQAARISAP